MSDREKLPTVPEWLKEGGRGLWERLIAEYDINDAAGLALVENACQAYDRARECALRIEEEGLVIENRMGTKVENPFCKMERSYMSQLQSALKALNLDLEPLNGGPGRPSGMVQPTLF